MEDEKPAAPEDVTDRQTDRQAGRQVGRQTDRQTETDRQTDYYVLSVCLSVCLSSPKRGVAARGVHMHMRMPCKHNP